MKWQRKRSQRAARTTLWLALAAYGGGTFAQTPVTLKTAFEYTAKIACSMTLPHSDGALAGGTYRTSIAIQNPGIRAVTIAANIAVTKDFGAPPGPLDISPYKAAEIPPGGALEIDCGDAARYFCPINGACIDFTALDGFVVIKSPAVLTVVSLYTARPAEGEVASLAVDRIPARPSRGVVNLPPASAGTSR